MIDAGTTVTLIEKNRIGQESSWAGGGILLPLYPWRQAEAITHLVLQSIKLYPEITQQLQDDTPTNPELRTCGLFISQNPDINAAITWCTKHGLPFESTPPAFCDNLNAETNNPLWLPTIGQVRNPRLLSALRQDLLNKGVTLLEHCHIQSVNLKQDTISHLKWSNGTLAINQLVLAAGAWTQEIFGQLFPQLTELSPQIVPVRGQMLLYQAELDTLPHIILDGGHYLIPRLDGKIVVGSTVENQGFDKSTTLEAKQYLHEFATRLLPALKNYPLTHHWAGLRPGTQEGIPYIDRHPGITNLSINAGHFRNGLVMGAASAQLMADRLLGRTPHIDPKPYTFTNLNSAL